MRGYVDPLVLFAALLLGSGSSEGRSSTEDRGAPPPTGKDAATASDESNNAPPRPIDRGPYARWSRSPVLLGKMRWKGGVGIAFERVERCAPECVSVEPDVWAEVERAYFAVQGGLVSCLTSALERHEKFDDIVTYKLRKTPDSMFGKVGRTTTNVDDELEACTEKVLRKPVLDAPVQALLRVHYKNR